MHLNTVIDRLKDYLRARGHVAWDEDGDDAELTWTTDGKNAGEQGADESDDEQSGATG